MALDKTEHVKTSKVVEQKGRPILSSQQMVHHIGSKIDTHDLVEQKTSTTDKANLGVQQSDYTTHLTEVQTYIYFIHPTYLCVHILHTSYLSLRTYLTYILPT